MDCIPWLRRRRHGDKHRRADFPGDSSPREVVYVRSYHNFRRSDSLPRKVVNMSSYPPSQRVSHNSLLSGRPGGALKFTVAELNKITGNFSKSRKIGQGGSGSVYRGQLQDGTTVAVRRIKLNEFGIKDSKEFQNAAEILARVEHVNLVRLIGFVEEGDERILVTEYVTNGNLRQHLDGTGYGVILDMSKRLNIAVDVAQALTHLHYFADGPIIHSNIKSSKILITDTFCAKVVGFGDGLGTHVPTRTQGTAGYLDPEFLTTHDMNMESDVYSFGILLVELFTRRRPLEPRRPHDERVTIRWAFKQFVMGMLKSIIDPNIEPTTASLAILERVFELAFSCSAPTKVDRPSMAEAKETWWSIRKEYQNVQVQSNVKEDDKDEAREGTKWSALGSARVGIVRNVHSLRLEELEAPDKVLEEQTDYSNPSQACQASW